MSGSGCSSWRISQWRTAPAFRRRLGGCPARSPAPHPCHASRGAGRRTPGKPSGLVSLHSITQLDISASQIRDRALRGKSLRYLLPDAVIDYLNENQLYV